MNEQPRPALNRPGAFGFVVAADNRRGVFDLQNESVLASGVPIDAVFIGDSITDGWALDAFFQGTGGLLINRGIGGDRTAFLRRRFEADVLQLRPEIVVLLHGINNTWDLDTWWDAQLRRTPEEIASEIVADTSAILEIARQQHLPVALCSMLPTDILYNANTPVRNRLVATVNAQMHNLVTGPNEVFVDYHTHFVSPDGVTLAPGWADDGLHPHVVGYRKMAAILLEHLEQAGLSILMPRAPSFLNRA